MLTTRPPFPDGTVLQKLLSHSSEAPPDPRRLRPDLPDELVPVMTRMLAKKPSERYSRPSDLIGDLLILADRLGLSTNLHGEPIWITSEARHSHWLRRHVPWIVPTTLLIVFALFFDLSWLDGGTVAPAQPRFDVPTSAEQSVEGRVNRARLPIRPEPIAAPGSGLSQTSEQPAQAASLPHPQDELTFP